MPVVLDPLGPSFKSYVKVGDVVMVAQDLVDKTTKKPFTWRYLGVVTKVGVKALLGLRLGADDKYALFRATATKETYIQLLAENEWPDGARAFRTVLILEGKLEIY